MIVYKTLEAIIKIIDGYVNDTLVHNCISCPLCQLHYDIGCSSCPNMVFNLLNLDGVPCYQRRFEYRQLDYSKRENNAYLAKFWGEVEEYIISLDLIEFKITDKIIEDILKIAEKYK